MRQYEMMEFSYEGKAPKNDFVHINLNAEFTHLNDTVYVKGFYDGNGIYRIRFLPLSSGEYSYKVSGLFNAEGTFTVLPADTLHHGPVYADGRHFRYADGKYYNAIGTTVYALVHQEDTLLEETLETLAKAPFNKVRLCVFPKHYQYNHNEPPAYPFELFDATGKIPDFSTLTEDETRHLWNVWRPDFAFWHRLEHVLLNLQEKGIEADLILFHPYDRWGFSRMGMKDNLVYLDYVLRRLSAFPNIWWSMANEYDLMSDLTLDDWYTIENYIAQNDSYHHLLSCHNFLLLYNHSRKNISHVSIQSRTVSRVIDLLQQYNKPVSFDECAYEGNLEDDFGCITSQTMTANFWKAFVNGGHCTHGETYIDYSQENIDDAVVWWAKGGKLIGESPSRICFLKELLDTLPGPIEPYLEGINKILFSDLQNIQQLLSETPDEAHAYLNCMAQLDKKEQLYQKVACAEYIGHVKEDVYLYYFAENQHTRCTLQLPKIHQYNIDLIDTWNMTRTNIQKGVNGNVKVLMPQKQWLAILAYRA